MYVLRTCTLYNLYIQYSTYVYSCFENTKIIKKNLYCIYVLHMCNFKPNSIVYIEESFASKLRLQISPTV